MRENGVHRIEVHVGCICIDHDRVLILRRTPERRLYPGLWECGGGQVRAGEGFGDAVRRQLREEAGVLAEPVMPLDSYEIPVPGEDQKKIPGMYFACRFEGYADGKGLKRSDEHSEIRWQPVNELDGLEFIPGVRENVQRSLDFVGRDLGQ